MKKIFFVLMLFTFCNASAQIVTDYFEFQGAVTTTIRDALVVPTGGAMFVWNTTTQQFEYAKDDEVWSAFGSGSGDFFADGSVPMTGDLDLDGNDLLNPGSLGTPTSLTLTNATGLPVSTGVSGLGTGVATFLATPSSDNLAAAVTGETGTGGLVFQTGATLINATLTGTTLNSSVDANGQSINDIINLSFEVTDVPPTGVEGRFYADDSENRPKYYDGTTYKAFLLAGDGTGTDDQTAAEVTYDNSSSGLTATDVQAAIDELGPGGGVSQETIEDFVGGMVTGNSETKIDVTYDDSGGKLDFSVDDDLSGYDNTSADFIASKGTGRTNAVQITDIWAQTQADFDTDGAPSSDELVIITDAENYHYIQLATIYGMGEISAATDVAYWKAPADGHIVSGYEGVNAKLFTYNNGISIAIEKNGSSITSTSLTIDESSGDSDNAASPFSEILSTDLDFVRGDVYAFEIESAGTGNYGLLLTLKVYYD